MILDGSLLPGRVPQRSHDCFNDAAMLALNQAGPTGGLLSNAVVPSERLPLTGHLAVARRVP